MAERRETLVYDIQRKMDSEVKKAYEIVMDTFEKWSKGDLKLSEQSMEDLAVLEMSFNACSKELDMSDPKLSRFRRDTFVAITK